MSFTVLFVNSQAWAWGVEGHQIVAAVAQQHLSKVAQAEVERLLALEPGATLTSISTWADEVRSPGTAPWHYLNFMRGDCRYHPEKICPDGQCAVAALEAQKVILASGAPDLQRLEALKWIVHLVGDLHQPLHGGFVDDRGGNRFQLEWLGKGTNLHAMWDSGLIKQIEMDGGRAEVLQGMSKLHPGLEGDAAVWAEESCRIASATDFYPSSHHLSSGYARRWGSVMVERLEQAAERLAMVLNSTLDGRTLKR